MLFRIFTVMAVLALALSTWILSSPGRRPRAAADAGAADLPGYYLKNALLTDFDADGAPSLHLQAERIDQIDHSSEVALSDVRVDYQAPNGRNWVLFGDFARVAPGGSVIDVSSNVRLQGDPAGAAQAGEVQAGAAPGMVVVHTDELSYDVPAAVATSDSDVRIEYGPRVLTAHGMVANLKERTMRLESKVNGRFHR